MQQTSSRVTAGFLMKQTLFGESLGVPLLTKIRKQVDPHLEGKTALARNITRQIQDEQNHIQIYSQMLKNSEFLSHYAISDNWNKTFDKIKEYPDDTLLKVVAVYGLIEPFNKISVEENLIPRLNARELQEVKAILDDEDRHIEMLDAFEDEFGNKITAEQKQRSLDFLKFYLQQFKEGVQSPTGEVVGFTKDARWSFLRKVGDLKSKIEAW